MVFSVTRKTPNRLIGAVIGLFSLIGGALAQEDVIAAAEDAFGLRIGVESIGLYSESQVRGFRLEDAGNFRMNDAYFVRGSTPSNAVLSGVETRIGANAMAFDLVGPSGVIAYSLPDPFNPPRDRLELGFGFYGSVVAELIGSTSTPDGSAALTGGVLLYPFQNYSDGTTGDFGAIGGVGGWRMGANTTLTSFADFKKWFYDSDTGYLPSETALPVNVVRRKNRGPAWTGVSILDRNYGAIVKHAFSPAWNIRASLIRSQSDIREQDFNLLAATEEGDLAQASIFVIPDSFSDNVAGEVVLDRTLQALGYGQRLSLTARGRITHTETIAARAVDGGLVPLREGAIAAPEPVFTFPEERDETDINQTAFGLIWDGGFGRWFDINAGVQRTDYRKDFAPLAGEEENTKQVEWLYNISAASRLTERFTIYASASRGLEELGIAPDNAVNRNQVLPAAVASQIEAGAGLRLSDSLEVIATAFSIEKANPGFIGGGVFGLDGEVRHQGVEASLSGEVAEGVDIVLGAVAFDAEVKRDNGETSAPVGASEILATGAVNANVPGVDGLAVDASATWFGPRYVNAANTLRTDGYATVTLGARYDLRIGETDARLRLIVRNINNQFNWIAQPSGLLFYTRPRSVRLTLTLLG